MSRMPERSAWSGWALIAVGGVLLLHSLEVVSLWALSRYWPLLLIAVGVRLVVQGRGGGGTGGPPPPPPGA